MTKGKIIRLAIGILCLLAAIAIGVYVFMEYYRRYAAEKAMKELAPVVVEKTEPSAPIVDSVPVVPPEPEPEPVYVPEKDLDWTALREANPHIYAWIFVPGTTVDYPVLQHPDQDSFYLLHNLDGSKGYPGCIYSEKSFNGKEFDDPVTVLYGHNMKNGKMFTSLHNFEDKELFAGENMIYIYTESGNYAYEIFSAFELDDRHLLYGWDLSVPESLLEYQRVLRHDGKGQFKDIEITEEDKLIILSTCVTGGRNEVRFMLEGRLLGGN